LDKHCRLEEATFDGDIQTIYNHHRRFVGRPLSRIAIHRARVCHYARSVDRARTDNVRYAVRSCAQCSDLPRA
jgi:hypothetical protein